MPSDRNRRWPTAAAAALVLVFAAAWIILGLTEDRPRWTAVLAPPAAAVGRTLEFRVTLAGSVGPGLQVDCTLHHADAERKGWGYLASAGPPQPAVGGRTYSFLFRVPERADTAFVFAIVYLSPTGRWPEATRAVSTEYIPVASGDGAGAGLRKARLYRYPTAAESDQAAARAGRPRGRPSVWVHPVLSILLLAGAFFAARAAARSKAPGPPDDGAERAAWLVIAVLLAAGAAVEISGLAGHVAAWGRRWAEQQGLYELRRPFQKALTAAASAGLLGLFLLFIRALRRPGSHRVLWWAGIGLAAYLAVSFVGVLSFHAIDAVRRLVWHGLSPFDAARGAGAAVAMAAAWLASRRKAGPKPT